MSPRTSSRSNILKRLRAQNVAEVPLPELTGSFTSYPDVGKAFSEAVQRAAGKVLLATDHGGSAPCISQLAEFREASHICSLTDEVGGNVALSKSPHQYEHVDLLVARGQLGVAENGAVWLDDTSSPQRSVYFLAQHVILLLARRTLVHTMHEAYAQLQVAKRPFGCFVAGPSKTADIEQALVVGAHGPRSLTVVLD
jgi:L-lactate dehydrogenase complex protein LldG